MDAWEFAGGEFHLVNVFNTFFLLNSIAKLIMITRPPHSFASLIDFLWPLKIAFKITGYSSFSNLYLVDKR